jgi:membrane protein DedA with SNARE-associated domain
VFNTVYPFVLVYLTGLLGIWKAVPVGFLFGLHPLGTWLFTVLGATTAVFILYFFGTRIRTFLERKRKKPFKKSAQHRAVRLMDKYGTAGLGFFGVLLMGPNLTLLIGIALVSSPRKLLVWTLAGILVWTLGLTLTAHLGIDIIQQF